MGAAIQLEVCDRVYHIRRAPKFLGAQPNPKTLDMTPNSSWWQLSPIRRTIFPTKKNTTSELNENFIHHSSIPFFVQALSPCHSPENRPHLRLRGFLFSCGHGAPSRAAAKPGTKMLRSKAAGTLLSGWERDNNWDPSSKRLVPR